MYGNNNRGSSGKSDGTAIVVIVLLLIGSGMAGIFGSHDKGGFLWDKLWGNNQSVATKSVEKGTKEKVDSVTKEASKGNTVYDASGSHDLGDADTEDINDKGTATTSSDASAVLNVSELPKVKRDAVVLTINKDKSGLNIKRDFGNYSTKATVMDKYRRVTGAKAVIGASTKEDKDLTSKATPSGWSDIKVDGKALYKRTPLVSGNSSGEIASPKYWMTGTKWFYNTKGVYDKKVLSYATSHRENVYYSVVPLFKGTEHVARAIQLRAISEDKKLNFNKVIYNIQPDTTINYQNGTLK